MHHDNGLTASNIRRTAGASVIDLLEAIARVAGAGGEVAGIGWRIEHADLVRGVLDQVVHHGRPDEAHTAVTRNVTPCSILLKTAPLHVSRHFGL